MKGLRWLVPFALATACATGEYRSEPAERPLTPREIAAHDLTVVDEGAQGGLAEAFMQALAQQGFRVVNHPPFHGELEVTLATQPSPQGPVAVAVMTSDGFFVDEARAHLDRGDAAAAWLAKTLAISERMAEYVRNSGTVDQTNFAK
ncbi:MAG TPA: hypothetical protein VGH20_11105 [Myxococcales bacterium]|jgi:hypothetical protein